MGADVMCPYPKMMWHWAQNSTTSAHFCRSGIAQTDPFNRSREHNIGLGPMKFAKASGWPGPPGRCFESVYRLHAAAGDRRPGLPRQSRMLVRPGGNGW